MTYSTAVTISPRVERAGSNGPLVDTVKHTENDGTEELPLAITA